MCEKERVNGEAGRAVVVRFPIPNTTHTMDHQEGRYKVKSLALADAGRRRIEWAESRMPVLMRLRDEYAQTQPFKGYKITGCLHVTKETAVLIETLAACGAEVAWSGCNPLSTNDEVAAALAAGPRGDGDGVEIYAWYGQDTDAFYWCIDRTIDKTPHTTLDDGADLIFRVHSAHPDKLDDIIGGSEETTTGVHRLRAMADDGKLGYPVYAVNDAETKWDFDNVYGTGQSTLDGILRASSVLLAGKNFVVAGYGHCGRGVAMRAKGMGANVIVTEVKATAALKATLDGMRVMTMEEAAKAGDIFVTATGMKDVIRGEHFVSMKEGAIVCNTGHYDVELNLKELAEASQDTRVIREDNREYTLDNGKKVLRPGRRPAREPRRRRGPPVGGHGHELRQPVPGPPRARPRPQGRRGHAEHGPRPPRGARPGDRAREAGDDGAPDRRADRRAGRLRDGLLGRHLTRWRTRSASPDWDGRRHGPPRPEGPLRISRGGLSLCDGTVWWPNLRPSPPFMAGEAGVPRRDTVAGAERHPPNLIRPVPA